LGPSQTVNLPEGGSTVRGSYNQLYVSSLADKAKEEYEAWLSRKAEREGGVGDEDGYGTRDWEPKGRVVARPGAVEGLAHSDGFSEKKYDPTSAVIPTEQQQWNEYTYVYPDQSTYAQPGYPMQAYDPTMMYWDPSYWWGTTPSLSTPVSDSDSSSNTGQSTDDEPRG
jgi:hypothetical protein